MNWAVVMAGGRGTRFWPESRTKTPKPFLKLLGKRSILEETVRRLSPLFPPSRILIVLQSDQVGEARRLLKRLPKENILGEPVGRNTAPCCLYAAAQIARRDPHAKFVFLPSDQFIRPQPLFLKTLRTAFKLADDRPVLLGMQPDAPHTGYGYLEVHKKKKIRGISYFRVARFHEKPSLKKARQFLKRGNFLWNGGTFVWTSDAFKQAIRRHLPRLYSSFEKLAPKHLNHAKLAKIYRALPSISLDYGVMEKMKNVHCLLAPFEWKDLGGWLGLAEFWPKDGARNRFHGKTLFVKSRNNIVKSTKRLTALLGVEDFLVIDTPDALLVCPRNRTEEIRDLVRELERKKESKYL